MSHVRVGLVVPSSNATVETEAGDPEPAPRGNVLLPARHIALVTPYMKPLAQQVVVYLEAEGFEVADWRALEVEDNHAVGCIPGDRVMEAARSLDPDGVDALVISACVQMPSLSLVETAEQEFGTPVLSAATAGAYSILRAGGLPVDIPDAGSLLRAVVSTS